MKSKFLYVVLSTALTVCSVHAESGVFFQGKWSMGMGINTLGIGATVAYKLNNSFKVRGIANYFELSRKFNNDPLKVKADARLFTVGILGDWHVLQNGFRLTGGLLYNANRFDIKATPSQNFTINGTTYTPAAIGEVNGSLNFRPIAPYLGIGYDSNHNKKFGFGFTVDAGVLFQGSARGKVKSISGQLANNARAINDSKDEAVRVVNKNRLIKTYPVISFGLSYVF